MSISIYGKNVPTFRHEKHQILPILKSLQDIYANTEDYCYCLINAEWSNRGIRRQYDLLIFEKHCISIIELKNWKGSLSLHVDDNKKEASVYRITDGSRSRDLKWDQIYHEQSFLKQYLSYDFRKQRSLDQAMKFRIDQYLIFNSPLNQDDVKINGIVEKWLTIATLKDFKQKFTASNKEQPFTLTENDIQYIAHNKFGLKKRDIDNVFISNLDALKMLSTDLKTLNKFDYDDEYELIVDHLLNNNRSLDFENLINKMSNLNEIVKDTDLIHNFRNVLDSINHSYNDDQRSKLLNDRFVNALLNIINILMELYKNGFSKEDYRLRINDYLDKIDSLLLIKMMRSDPTIPLTNKTYKHRKDVIETLEIIHKIQNGVI